MTVLWILLGIVLLVLGLVRLARREAERATERMHEENKYDQ